MSSLVEQILKEGLVPKIGYVYTSPSFPDTEFLVLGTRDNSKQIKIQFLDTLEIDNYDLKGKLGDFVLSSVRKPTGEEKNMFKKSINYIFSNKNVDKSFDSNTISKLKKLGFKIPLSESILLEAKQVGTLYHYTRLGRILKILDNNLLASRYWAKENKKGYFGISTTRDKNFHITANRVSDGIEGISVRIALNGNKISEKYKIVSVNFWNEFSDSKGVARPKNTESEELILSKDGLRNLKSYILEITIFLNEEKSSEAARNIKFYIKEIKKHGIEINMDEVDKSYVDENPDLFPDELELT